jgi:hypothetical protein
MVVREQHPLDALYADFAQMVQHAAVAEVNQQRRVTRPQHVHVAGVHPDEEVGLPARVRLLEFSPGGRGRKNQQPGKQRRGEKLRSQHSELRARAWNDGRHGGLLRQPPVGGQARALSRKPKSAVAQCVPSAQLRFSC